MQAGALQHPRPRRVRTALTLTSPRHTPSKKNNHHHGSSSDRVNSALVPLGALLIGWLQSCSEEIGK
jgi:hypothetical protein